jgi:hypothetical protein
MVSKARLLILAFSVLLFLPGCDWVDDTHEAHADTEGFQIVVDGQVVVQWREGVVTGSVPLEIPIGQSHHLTVRFLDHDGKVIPVDEIDSITVMSVEVADPTLVELVMDDTDPWSFDLTGIEAGDTELSIGLRHGPDHFDFTPRAVSIRVVA